jgi:sulfate/thiosulfate transport system substrate-binding protein
MNWNGGRANRVLVGVFLLWAFAPGCKGTGDSPEGSSATSLTLGAYTTPREAYGKAIVPAFRRAHREQTGRTLEVRDSFMASGAQARAIVGGFEADVAALSLEPDVELIQKAGLIEHDWKSGPHGGTVTRSIVVIGVREGNPKNIRDFEDLAREGVQVLTPNVRMSGGAMWNILGIVGAAARGHAGVERTDDEAIVALLAAVLRNVKIMDRGARDSMLTFERGVGDAIITYENEILVGRAGGKTYEVVVPRSTVLIENPVAVVDAYARRHGVLDDARAFVDFLYTEEAQRAFAEHGLRPVVPSVEDELAGRFPVVQDLFTVADLGGWPAVQARIFGQGGLYDRALAESRRKR